MKQRRTKLPTKTIVLTILQLSQQTLMNLKIHKILVLETMVDDEVEFITVAVAVWPWIFTRLNDLPIFS